MHRGYVRRARAPTKLYLSPKTFIHSYRTEVKRLTDIERVCFTLKHLEQWRAKEISAELDINEGRVKQAVFRAVKKLRVSMQDMQRENYE